MSTPHSLNGRPTRGEYFAISGYRDNPADFDAPYSMARRIASYISDASTVRVRVLDQFGRAPSIERIKKMRSEHLRERELRNAALALDEVDEEPKWFKPVSLVKPPKYVAAVAPARPVVSIDDVFPAPIVEDWRDVQLFTASDVLHACALVFDVSVGEILGTTRERQVAHARHLTATILKARGSSYPQVALRINRGDHSTVINSLQAFFSTVIRRDGMDEAFDHLAPDAFRGVRTFAEFTAIDKVRRAA